MIQITQWSPDTCKCSIEYEWDNTISQDIRVHTLKNIINSCPEHALLSNDIARYKAVVNENQTKNKLYGKILIDFPLLTTIINNSDGTTSTIFAIGKEPTFVFNANYIGDGRSIQVNIPTLTIFQKNTYQDILDAQFGAKKVIIK